MERVAWMKESLENYAHGTPCLARRPLDLRGAVRTGVADSGSGKHSAVNGVYDDQT
jgi:hypothetical protein